jgi:hypothetical protein
VSMSRWTVAKVMADSDQDYGFGSYAARSVRHASTEARERLSVQIDPRVSPGKYAGNIDKADVRVVLAALAVESEMTDELAVRAEAAEADRERLIAALREIIAGDPEELSDHAWITRIARAELGEVTEG